MTYPDLIFLVGGLVLSAALLPAVRARTVMPLSGALVTAGVLTAYVPAFVALDAYASAGSLALNAAMWWVLVAVALRDRRRPRFASIRITADDRLFREAITLAEDRLRQAMSPADRQFVSLGPPRRLDASGHDVYDGPCACGAWHNGGAE